MKRHDPYAWRAWMTPGEKRGFRRDARRHGIADKMETWIKESEALESEHRAEIRAYRRHEAGSMARDALLAILALGLFLLLLHWATSIGL